MFKFTLKRILTAVPTLLILSLMVFLLMKAIPGDPAQLMLGERASEDALAKVRHELGLDLPIYQQYGLFLHKLLLELDLGQSVVTKEPVISLLAEKFPATLELAIAAMLFAVLIGIPMGLLASMKPGSLLDLATMGFSVFGVSMPVFWLGLMLMWIFGLHLEWLPLSGRIDIEFDYDQPITGLLLLDSLVTKDWDRLLDGIRHIILPAITLGTIPMAFLARMTRSAMMEVLKQDYIRTARSKGLGFFKVFLKHAFRNASLPVTTVLGLQFGSLLAGAMITETIFSWPGMGTFILHSVHSRDIPALEGAILLVAFSFVMINLLVDIAYQFLDPRVRI